MIPIRFAEPEDMPKLVAMGMEFLAATPRFRDMIPGDAPSLVRHFDNIMQDRENAVFFVLGERGDAFGMLAAVKGIQPHSSLLTVAELFWWVSPKRRGFATGLFLLRALFAWTKSVGAKRIQMVSPSKKVSELYRKLGFQRLEETYIMKVA